MNFLKSSTLIGMAVIAFSFLLNLTDSSTRANAIDKAEVKQKTSNYVGLRYQNVPKGLQDLGGWIVGSPGANPTYAISHVKKSQQKMLCFHAIARTYAKLYLAFLHLVHTFFINSVLIPNLIF